MSTRKKKKQLPHFLLDCEQNTVFHTVSHESKGWKNATIYQVPANNQDAHYSGLFGATLRAVGMDFP